MVVIAICAFNVTLWLLEAAYIRKNVKSTLKDQIPMRWNDHHQYPIDTLSEGEAVIAVLIYNQTYLLPECVSDLRVSLRRYNGSSATRVVQAWHMETVADTLYFGECAFFAKYHILIVSFCIIKEMKWWSEFVFVPYEILAAWICLLLIHPNDATG